MVAAALIRGLPARPLVAGSADRPRVAGPSDSTGSQWPDSDLDPSPNLVPEIGSRIEPSPVWAPSRRLQDYIRRRVAAPGGEGGKQQVPEFTAGPALFSSWAPNDIT